MSDIKFNCPGCNSKLVVEERGAGLTVPCPDCKRNIVIPQKQMPISIKSSNQLLEKLVKQLSQGKTNTATARLQLKQKLDSSGYDPVKFGIEPNSSKNLAGALRLDLILDTNVALLANYENWRQGQDDAILDMYPAQELFEAYKTEIEPDWKLKWTEAGGKFFENRMIALKDDHIWQMISGFNLPYPPFSIGSGMDIEDVDRDEAERFGLITTENEINKLSGIFKPLLLTLDDLRLNSFLEE